MVGNKVVFNGDSRNINWLGLVYEPPKGWSGAVTFERLTLIYIDSWYRGRINFRNNHDNNRLRNELAFSKASFV
jgi:hypothetical protein